LYFFTLLPNYTINVKLTKVAAAGSGTLLLTLRYDRNSGNNPSLAAAKHTLQNITTLSLTYMTISII